LSAKLVPFPSFAMALPGSHHRVSEQGTGRMVPNRKILLTEARPCHVFAAKPFVAFQIHGTETVYIEAGRVNCITYVINGKCRIDH